MTVLTLLLTGPMQSWGTDSRFTRRTTQDAPSKSAIIGLLAAARGLRRTDPLGDLLNLAFGVRIEEPGRLLRDFQTARSLDGARVMPLSERFYRSDATYLAAVDGPRPLLEGLAEAIKRPVFPLYLGRRSCPPAGPIHVTIHDRDLTAILKTLPWQVPRWRAQQTGPRVDLEMLWDADDEGDLVRDEPIAFDPASRQYGWRRVARRHITVDNPHARKQPTQTPDDLDFMSVLEG